MFVVTAQMSEAVYITSRFISECELPDVSVLYSRKKIAAIRSELDSKPADSTPAPHSFFYFYFFFFFFAVNFVALSQCRKSWFAN